MECILSFANKKRINSNIAYTLIVKFNTSSYLSRSVNFEIWGHNRPTVVFISNSVVLWSAIVGYILGSELLGEHQSGLTETGFRL